uniref:Serrate RNA effector molecule homolog n=1 Tax=Scapholeberis mucronata TaxID=202097 RepID=A0A4Y7NJZ6_9CRUS|nr:EOG090X04A7 [Scapholeberis mucronata]SVE93549.1 EOG090X04A7 [Scapholeberis mucronata]
MGDSDDDHDRRRRDKFRGERSEYRGTGDSGRREERGNLRREEWNERAIMEPRRGESWNSQRGSRTQPRHEYRDSYRGRERYSPAGGYEAPQPPKRMRPDWEDRRYGFEAGYGSGMGSWGQNEGAVNLPSNNSSYGGTSSRGEEFPTQPPMMSFKAFLAAHDDSISDEEAVKKYAEYKLEFRRQQLNEFFTSHKDEEWFKLKYHPEENLKRKNEHKAHIESRMKVLMEIMEEKRLDQVTIDADQSEKLVKLLDTIVIKLEGGSENDLHALENPVESTADKPLPKTQEPPAKISEPKEPVEVQNDENKADSATEEPKTETAVGPSSPLNGGKRKRGNSDSESGSDWEGEPKEEAPQSPDGKTADVPLSPSEAPEANHEDQPKEEEDGEKAQDDNDVKEKEQKGNGVPNQPRELHRTASIFLRNLAPTITKLEVEAMCKRYPGFLRAAIADPQPERRWFRRGWVTFERSVNIKEICWNLNNIRLRDTELGAIVNRDLSRRIRTVSGITSHKQVVRNDIRLAAKIIQNLDARLGLWTDGEDKSKDSMNADSTLSFSGTSRNPVLHNITDYLIEEASAEEEELLGASASEEGEEADASAGLTRDDELIKVLDRLLFYLRIVHSVDYYNHCEYPNEDEMPNRCGIMHARGIPPSSKVTQAEINDYCRSFEQKIASFLEPIKRLSEEEASKLGLKESKAEVEKFVAANTQELAKDKWLCPLSGKKFKGPDFVRKHIFNKHGEKIEEVRKDVEYFNNYLHDPKRPQLPEHPGNRAAGVRPSPINEPQRGDHFGPPGGFGFGGFNYGGGRGGYGGGFGGPPPMPGFGNVGGGRDFGFGGRNNRGGRGRGPLQSSYEGRTIIGYDDVDTPADFDVF